MCHKLPKLLILLGIASLFLGSMTPLHAQEPRPTPTMMPAQETPRPTETPLPPTATPEPEPSSTNQELRGSIRGMVYEDVNGDGACINTGVAGENPVVDVTIEFVSSDEQTVINLTSGPDGGFGLFAAGLSYWAVTAKPGSEWVVTSDQTRYAPVYEGSLNIADVNFCVQEANAARVLLPASGGVAVSPWLMGAVLLGLLFIALGISLEVRRKGS